MTQTAVTDLGVHPGFTSVSGNGVTYFGAFVGLGFQSTTSTTEANSQSKNRTATTLQNIYCNVVSNSRTTTTTITSRNASAGGNLSISISAASTGVKSDTTHSDSVADAAMYGYQVAMGASAEALDIPSVAAQLVTASQCYKQLGATKSSFSVVPGSTSFFQLAGLLSGNTIESDSTIVSIEASTTSNMQIIVSSAGAAGTLTSRVTGGPGNQTLSVGGSTGFFEDTTHSDSVLAADLLALKYVAGAGGPSLTLVALKYLGSSSNKSPINSAGTTVFGTTSTQYWSLGGASGKDSTETNCQSAVPAAVTASLLYVKIRSNSIGTNQNFQFRKNTANGSQVAVVTATTIGTFSDVTHTDSLAVGDLVDCSTASTFDTNMTVGTYGVMLDAGGATPPVVQSNYDLPNPDFSRQRWANALRSWLNDPISNRLGGTFLYPQPFPYVKWLGSGSSSGANSFITTQYAVPLRGTIIVIAAERFVAGPNFRASDPINANYGRTVAGSGGAGNTQSAFLLIGASATAAQTLITLPQANPTFVMLSMAFGVSGLDNGIFAFEDVEGAGPWNPSAGASSFSASGTTPSLTPTITGGPTGELNAIIFCWTVIMAGAADAFTEAPGYITIGAVEDVSTGDIMRVAYRLAVADSSSYVYAPVLGTARTYHAQGAAYWTYPAAPFYETDHPVPVAMAQRDVRWPVAGRTHLDPYKLNLAGKDQFFSGPGAGPEYDWPNPVGTTYAPTRWPVAGRTHLDPYKLNLAGQDKFFSGPGAGPEYDWPNPSRLTHPSVRFPVANRVHLDPQKLNLRGQDKFFGAAGVGPDYDWPNPVGAMEARRTRWAIHNRTHLQQQPLEVKGQDAFFHGAGRGPSYDWTNPPRVTALQQQFWPLVGRYHGLGLLPQLYGQDSFFRGQGVGPSYDWPNPAFDWRNTRGRRPWEAFLSPSPTFSNQIYLVNVTSMSASIGSRVVYVTPGTYQATDPAVASDVRAQSPSTYQATDPAVATDVRAQAPGTYQAVDPAVASDVRQGQPVRTTSDAATTSTQHDVAVLRNAEDDALGSILRAQTPGTYQATDPALTTDVRSLAASTKQASDAAVATDARQTQLPRSVSDAAIASDVRQTNLPRSASDAAVASDVRSLLRSLSAINAALATMTESAISIWEAQASTTPTKSLLRNTSALRSASNPAVASIVRFTTSVGYQATDAAVSSTTKSLGRVLVGASDAAVASLVRSALLTKTASSAAVTSLVRVSGKPLQATGGTATSAKHDVSVIRQATDAAVATLLRAYAQSVLQASDAAVATLVRSYGTARLASSAAVATLTRTGLVARSSSNSATSSLSRSTALTRTTTDAAVASLAAGIIYNRTLQALNSALATLATFKTTAVAAQALDAAVGSVVRATSIARGALGTAVSTAAKNLSLAATVFSASDAGSATVQLTSLLPISAVSTVEATEDERKVTLFSDQLDVALVAALDKLVKPVRAALDAAVATLVRDLTLAAKQANDVAVASRSALLARAFSTTDGATASLDRLPNKPLGVDVSALTSTQRAVSAVRGVNAVSVASRSTALQRGLSALNAVAASLTKQIQPNAFRASDGAVSTLDHQAQPVLRTLNSAVASLVRFTAALVDSDVSAVGSLARSAAITPRASDVAVSTLVRQTQVAKSIAAAPVGAIVRALNIILFGGTSFPSATLARANVQTTRQASTAVVVDGGPHFVSISRSTSNVALTSQVLSNQRGLSAANYATVTSSRAVAVTKSLAVAPVTTLRRDTTLHALSHNEAVAAFLGTYAYTHPRRRIHMAVRARRDPYS